MAAAAWHPQATAAAASQDWSPFVLVAGLLLVGLVVADDGLFAAAGRRLAAAASGDGTLLVGVVALVTVVTAVLNLDTSVAFVTPVVVHGFAERRRPGTVAVAACLLLSNAASLLLPGANLTNLIVLGSNHQSGAQFAAHAVPAAAVAVGVTTLVVVLAHRRVGQQPPTAALPPADGGSSGADRHHAARPRWGVGAVAVVAVTVAVVALPDAALPVLGVGLVAVAVRILQRRLAVRRASEAVGPQVLVGLFGLAVALGTIGRIWSGPSTLLHQTGLLATAGLGAAATVVANNLPAASLLGARGVAHPVALLVGLNVGPNLFATGSLSWLLWLRAARQAGAAPSVRRTALLGVLSAPPAIVAAVGILALAH